LSRIATDTHAGDLPADYDKLRDHLLAIGGVRLGVLPTDQDFSVLQRGKSFDAAAAKLRRMERSRCHSNAASLWCQSRKRIRIASGYALSEDGIWRRHSWGSDSGRVIETTVERVAYFGYELDDSESLPFALGNPPRFLRGPVAVAEETGDWTYPYPFLFAKFSGRSVEAERKQLRELGVLPQCDATLPRSI
jgi:hypothetical protein